MVVTWEIHRVKNMRRHGDLLESEGRQNPFRPCRSHGNGDEKRAIHLPNISINTSVLLPVFTEKECTRTQASPPLSMATLDFFLLPCCVLRPVQAWVASDS
jgi:hypothetical protein